MSALVEVKIEKGSVYKNDKEIPGWYFMVWYPPASYAGVVSALYRLKREAQAALNDYLMAGHLDTYGTAEK